VLRFVLTLPILLGGIRHQGRYSRVVEPKCLDFNVAQLISQSITRSHPHGNLLLLLWTRLYREKETGRLTSTKAKQPRKKNSQFSATVAAFAV
jgi:hypothetical protein